MKDKKNLKIFITIALGVILLFSLFFFISYLMNKEKGNTCSNLKTINEKDDCYLEWFYQEEKDTNKFNIYYCDLLSQDYQYKNYCYNLVATQEEDINICDKIFNNVDKLICKDDVFSNLGTLHYNPESCDNINDINKRDFCYYFSVDNPTKKMEFCFKIVSIEYKSKCTSRILDACNHLPTENEKSECLNLFEQYLEK